MRIGIRGAAILAAASLLHACGGSVDDDKASPPHSALLRIAIPVSDIEVSKEFYAHVLGFEPGFDGDITSPWVSELLQLEAGQTVRFAVLYGADDIDGDSSAMIGLLQVDNPPLPSLQRPQGASLATGESMMAMVTQDMEGVHLRLEEVGATILFGPTPSVDGSESELVFRDPDGMRIHVVQRHR